MATPSFVRYSYIHQRPDTLLRTLNDEVFRPRRIRLKEFGWLQPSYDEYDGGLELAADLVSCDDEDEALAKCAGWENFGLSYLVPDVPGYINLYFFAISDSGMGLSLSFDSSVLYYQSSKHQQGEWLESFLIGMFETIQTDVCGYGVAYRVQHEPLDPAEVVSLLQQGKLLSLSPPTFHALAPGLIDREELLRLLTSRPKSQYLRYKTTTAGSHILSALP